MKNLPSIVTLCDFSHQFSLEAEWLQFCLDVEDGFKFSDFNFGGLNDLNAWYNHQIFP